MGSLFPAMAAVPVVVTIDSSTPFGPKIPEDDAPA